MVTRASVAEGLTVEDAKIRKSSHCLRSFYRRGVDAQREVMGRVSDAGSHGRGHAHQWPAFESRQGRKARELGRPLQRALWGIWLVPTVQRRVAEPDRKGASERQMVRQGAIEAREARSTALSGVIERRIASPMLE